MGSASVDIGSFFSTPHDRPPNLLLMLTESWQETRDIVIVAGFLGNEVQWKQCADLWSDGLGKRKGLHACALTALVAGIQVQDFHSAEQLLCGYRLGVMVIMDAIVKNLTKTETVKLVFEDKDQYEIRATQIFKAYQHFVTLEGKPQLSSIEFVAKHSSLEARIRALRDELANNLK